MLKKTQILARLLHERHDFLAMDEECRDSDMISKIEQDLVENGQIPPYPRCLSCAGDSTV